MYPKVCLILHTLHSKLRESLSHSLKMAKNWYVIEQKYLLGISNRKSYFPNVLLFSTEFHLCKEPYSNLSEMYRHTRSLQLKLLFIKFVFGKIGTRSSLNLTGHRSLPTELTSPRCQSLPTVLTCGLVAPLSLNKC